MYLEKAWINAFKDIDEKSKSECRVRNLNREKLLDKLVGIQADRPVQVYRLKNRLVLEWKT